MTDLQTDAILPLNCFARPVVASRFPSLAYSPPTNAPIEHPPMMSIGIPSFSIACKKPCRGARKVGRRQPERLLAGEQGGGETDDVGDTPSSSTTEHNSNRRSTESSCETSEVAQVRRRSCSAERPETSEPLDLRLHFVAQMLERDDGGRVVVRWGDLGGEHDPREL